MKITFGLSLDGYEPPKPENSLGAVVTGPSGMLDLLETRLGLGGEWPAQPIRVIQYQQCLQAVEDTERFYSRSLSIDALAVAKELLGWRDQWVAAGWDGSAADTDSQRIQDMAAVESFARNRLGKGVSDRLRVVSRTLETRDPGIEEVRLVDAIEHLPPAWKKVFKQLPCVSTDFDAWQGVTAAAGTDLSALQHALLTNTHVSFQGDGSFFVLEADSEQTLSLGLVGEFTGVDPRPLESTTVIAGKGGAVFDQGLRSADLPTSGRTNRSVWRPASQVLPLALSLVWKPLDPQRLLEFLSHPVCPVRKPLRSRLAKVVANTPGIGGADWNRTIDEARTEAIAKAEGDPKAGHIIDEMIDSWLALTRFEPDKGAPVPVLADHCARVARWAAGRANLQDLSEARRSSFLIAQKQAIAAAEAIDEVAKGDETLTRLQLERLIEEVMATGSGRPDLEAECDHVHVVGNAAAAINPIDRILWWDFSTPDLPRKWPWSPAELSQLQSHGVKLPSVDKMLQFLARTWLRPVMAARRQLILVMPSRHGREPAVHHYLWDQIVALLPEGETVSTLDYDRVLERGEQHPWLGADLESVPYRNLPTRQRWWRLKHGDLLGRRDVESFSSLQNFINTPHRWVLNHKARLSPGSLTKIGEDNRQKGALVHRLFEWLFTSRELDWRTADDRTVRAWIDKHFPVLLEQEGANYLLPGKARAAEQLRMSADSAMRTLIGHLRHAECESVRMEAPVEGDFCGGHLAGRIDMLVSNPTEREAVLDLKWGGYRYRCAELRDNHQLQLAVYAVMRMQETTNWPDQAYFILEEARLASQKNDYFENASVCAPAEEYANMQTLWLAFEATWKWRRKQLDAGYIELNVEGTEPDDCSLPPDGALPIAEASNRFEEYSALVGWPEGA